MFDGNECGCPELKGMHNFDVKAVLNHAFSEIELCAAMHQRNIL